jgi:hypothetical protein
LLSWVNPLQTRSSGKESLLDSIGICPDLSLAVLIETMQMDAVNAFLNSKLNDPIYVNYPQGYGQKGYVLQLNQALYGLCISPILWQQEISQKLT